MSEQDTGPAGADFTEDAAASLILGPMPDEDEGQHEPEPQTAEAATDESADEPVEVEEEGADEPSREDEPSEEDYYEFDKIHPDTPVRLRDGTVKRFGDVKRDWAELQEITRHKQEFEQERSSFQQQQAQIAQQAQFFQQTVPMALQVLQANLGEPPKPPEYTGDYVGYVEEKAAYDKALHAYQARYAQFQNLQQAQQRHAAEMQQRQQAEYQSRLQQEQQKLFAALPVLRDASKLQEFKSDMHKYGRDVYGFTEQELNNVPDHRFILMARDAIAYRKMQAQKPKAAAKAKDAPPVRAPGKRVTEAESKSRAYQEGLAKLRKTGSVDDAAALLLNDLA